MTPFSEKQMQVLCWWGEKSPHRNKLAVICDGAVREFSLYRWADDGARDVPVKENDHAMDDIRYFVSTVLGAGESFACAVQRETGKGVSIWDF